MSFVTLSPGTVTSMCEQTLKVVERQRKHDEHEWSITPWWMVHGPVPFLADVIGINYKRPRDPNFIPYGIIREHTAKELLRAATLAERRHGEVKLSMDDLELLEDPE